MRKLCFAIAVISCSLFASSSAALAVPLAWTDSPIDGTDLSIGLPDGWQVRPREMSADDLRVFVEEFPSMSAQLGLRAAASDEELTRLWERGMKDVTAVAFDPHDGDTVTIFVYSDLIWPNMTAWRAHRNRLHEMRQESCSQSTNERLVPTPRTRP